MSPPNGLKHSGGIAALSPALWFNDSTLVDIYADMIGKQLHTPRIFVSSGGLESDIDLTSGRFARRLNAMEKMKGRFLYRRYPALTHATTPTSLFDGLHFIFDPMISTRLRLSDLDPAKADSAAVFAALASDERTFAGAAHELGLSETLPENTINSLGYRFLGRLRSSSLSSQAS